ncbi:hypothetical protein WJX72_007665 [[Myrmecia] bisecta]|uniref:Uncharacterized protein n=1 Tax=[Myrmecia] bisecta TaxID=41462 RepID=A0AAW1PTS3_9CHLO
MDDHTRLFFEEEFDDVRCINLANRTYPTHHRVRKMSRFVFKAYAFYHASFSDILLLDADCIPVADPSRLFDSTEYQKSGNLFWPDFSLSMPAGAYGLFDLAVPTPNGNWWMAAESGQVLFNREQHADVLEWVWFLNLHGPDGLYKHMWGDKDSFQLAFHLAGKADDYRQVMVAPREVVCDRQDQDVKYLHTGMLQAQPDGQLAFMHRTDRGKFDPMSANFLTCDYVTEPLIEPRSQALFNNAGGFGFQDWGLDVGFKTQCNFTEPLSFHAECGLQLRSDKFPIAAIAIESYPKMQGIMLESYAAFRSIKAAIDAGELLTGACKGYDRATGMNC